MRDLDKITQHEKELVESLVNPDDPREKKYRWDLRYQQEVLGMLLMDKVFLIQSMQLVRPNYFVDKAHETICDILFNYFDKYKQLPAKFVIANEIRERFPNDDKKLLIYTGELEALTSSYIPGLESRDACLDKITEFAKEQSLRSAVSVTLDLLEKGQKDRWVKIETLFKQALLVDRSFDLGLDYFQTLEERYERMMKQNTEKEVFVTGFKGIDEDGLASGGICRGEIAAYMGMPGTGKSILLVKAAAKNVIRGKRVLYISLEMDQDKIAKRFDAQLAYDNIRTLLDKKDFVIAALKEHVKGEEDKRKLIIKQFAAGTADVQTIRAYLAQLNLHGWKPDMMCVDYIGEFKDPPPEVMKVYESRQRIVRDLRGLAVEENMAIFTALQPNRRGREAQENAGVIDDDMLGDSFGQARPLDALWSINQNQQEKAQGMGRIFVVKHRDGKSRYTVFFKQDKETLDILEVSQETFGVKMSEFAKKKTDSTEDNIEKVVGKKQFKPNEE